MMFQWYSADAAAVHPLLVVMLALAIDVALGDPPKVYARIPHPALTQLEGVSPPFNPASPPASQPLWLTVKQLQDILTYVSTLEPADLGAPLVEH